MRSWVKLPGRAKCCWVFLTKCYISSHGFWMCPHNDPIIQPITVHCWTSTSLRVHHKTQSPVLASQSVPATLFQSSVHVMCVRLMATGSPLITWDFVEKLNMDVLLGTLLLKPSGISRYIMFEVI